MARGSPTLIAGWKTRTPPKPGPGSTNRTLIRNHFCSKCPGRSEEHTSELQSQSNVVCRLLLDKKRLFARHVRDQCNLHGHPQLPIEPEAQADPAGGLEDVDRAVAEDAELRERPAVSRTPEDAE